MILNNLDLAGAQFFLRISAGNEKQKSQLGGGITLLVYVASLAYAVYVFILWGKGDILPKVTSQQIARNDLSLELPDGFMTIEGLFHGFNPFSIDNNILLPIQINYVNGEYQNVRALFSNSSNIEFPQTTLKRSINTEEDTDQYFMFVFSICSTELEFGQTCASEEIIQEFLNKLGHLLKIQVSLKQYNQQSNTFDSVIKESVLVIDSQYFLYNQIKLKTTLNQHDFGFLFENYQFQSYVNDREIVTQPVSSEFPKKFFEGLNPIFVTLVNLDSIQTVTTIVETKIGEVFAQIGSIISILMALQLISQNYNSIYLEKKLKEIIVQYLYPKLRVLTIRKNLIGQIIEVNYQGKYLTQSQLSSFIPQYKIAIDEAQSYLAIVTIIYKLIYIEQHLNIQNSKIEEIDASQNIEQTVKVKPNVLSQVQEREIDESTHLNDVQTIFRK